MTRPMGTSSGKAIGMDLQMKCAEIVCMSKDMNWCSMAHDSHECRKLEARFGTFQCWMMTRPMGTSSGREISMDLWMKCAEIICMSKDTKWCHTAHNSDEHVKLEARMGTFQCWTMTRPISTSSGKEIVMDLWMKCAEIVCMSKDMKWCHTARDSDECGKLEARMGTFQCWMMTRPMGTSSGKATGMRHQLKCVQKSFAHAKIGKWHCSIEHAGNENDDTEICWNECVGVLPGLLEVSQKDDANCECTHGQYHLLCFQCNPEETMWLCSTKSPPRRDGWSLSFRWHPDALVHSKQECHDTNHSHSACPKFINLLIHNIWQVQSNPCHCFLSIFFECPQPLAWAFQVHSCYSSFPFSYCVLHSVIHFESLYPLCMLPSLQSNWHSCHYQHCSWLHFHCPRDNRHTQKVIQHKPILRCHLQRQTSDWSLYS